MFRLLIRVAHTKYVRGAWSYTYRSVNFTKHNHPVIQAERQKVKGGPMNPNGEGHVVSGVSRAWDLVEQVLVVKALEVVLDHLR